MNILYLDIDSLRRDHLGCYGYHRNTSPVIDAIAAEALRFENIYASDVPCHPSRTALWSGRFGRVTGVVGHGGTASEPFREGSEKAWAGTFLDDGWMKALRDLDYHTTTVSSFAERHGCWHWYAGFNEVMNPGQRGMEQAHDVIPLAQDWLSRKGHDSKWFLHVNLWDPHTPYRAPGDFGDPFKDDPLPGWITQEVIDNHVRGYGPHSALEPNGYGYEDMSHYPRAPYPIDTIEKGAAWVNGYDTGIRYADFYIGKLFETMKQLDLFNDTIIIISSDHGENLGELNIWADHQTADDFTCNVPLVVRWPGKPDLTGVNEDLHYHFDWAATLIDLLGGAVPDCWNGKSFASTLEAGANGSRDYLVLSQGAWAAQHGIRFRGNAGEEWLMLRTYHDGYKHFGDTMLFDLASDPHEQKDVAADNPAVIDRGLRFIDDWKEGLASQTGDNPDPLQTVMDEGGPFHCRGELGKYLEHLRATNRSQHAEALARRHPTEIDIVNKGNIAIQ